MEQGIVVVGLGYVGLPLAVALARTAAPVWGFDVSAARLAELRAGRDHTEEVTAEDLRATKLRLTAEPSDLRGCSFFILAVPTPVDDERRPDLRPLLSACRSIGEVLAPGAVVVVESTVYPGLTREVCGPALADASGLRCGVDFHLGYSPERVNPGDRQHTLATTIKLIAADRPDILERIAAVYGPAVPAGLFRTRTIEIAEAAKVIENIQRDLNIALMNELAVIFDILDIPTREVLAAAATKWNFLRFVPGLVGGHCIGVDPYYLTALAERRGYHPHIILAGRRINDGMGAYIAQRVVKLMGAIDRPLRSARVGILGLAFKEDVRDLRNSRVPDIDAELRTFGVSAMIHDPLVDAGEALRIYDIACVPRAALTALDALVLAVPHRDFLCDPGSLLRMVRPGGVIVDVKSALDRSAIPDAITYSSL